MLEKNIESVNAMLDYDGDFDQIFLEDEVGHDIHWANQQFAAYKHLVQGDWVLMLDDDDLLLDPKLIVYLADHEEDDVVIFKMKYGGMEKPPFIPGEIKYGEVCTSSFVVRNHVYQDHIHLFGAPRAGDFSFISGLLKLKRYKVGWIDRVITGIQTIGDGRPEDSSG